MSTPSSVAKSFGIDDGKIFPLLVDDGTTLTYSPAIDVPGITAIKCAPKYTTKNLDGDEHLLDIYSKLDSIDWSLNHVKISLDVQAIMEGGTVTTSTATVASTTLTSAVEQYAKTISVTSATGVTAGMMAEIGTGSTLEKIQVDSVAGLVVTLSDTTTEAHASADPVVFSAGDSKVMTLTNTAMPGYFALIGQTLYSDAGDDHIILYKCKCTKYDVEKKGKDYVTISASGTAVGLNKDGRVKATRLDEFPLPISSAELA